MHDHCCKKLQVEQRKSHPECKECKHPWPRTFTDGGVCVCLRTRVSVRVRVCVCVCVRVRVRVRVCTCACVCMCMCMCVCLRKPHPECNECKHPWPRTFTDGGVCVCVRWGMALTICVRECKEYKTRLGGGVCGRGRVRGHAGM